MRADMLTRQQMRMHPRACAPQHEAARQKRDAGVEVKAEAGEDGHVKKPKLST